MAIHFVQDSFRSLEVMPRWRWTGNGEANDVVSKSILLIKRASLPNTCVFLIEFGSIW